MKRLIILITVFILAPAIICAEDYVFVPETTIPINDSSSVTFSITSVNDTLVVSSDIENGPTVLYFVTPSTDSVPNVGVSFSPSPVIYDPCDANRDGQVNISDLYTVFTKIFFGI